MHAVWPHSPREIPRDDAQNNITALLEKAAATRADGCPPDSAMGVL